MTSSATRQWRYSDCVLEGFETDFGMQHLRNFVLRHVGCVYFSDRTDCIKLGQDRMF